MSSGPKPEERQLKRRPESCPHCGSYLDDQFTWVDDDELQVDIGCPNCDWHAFALAEVTEPDAE